jgi:uncharacterized protein
MADEYSCSACVFTLRYEYRRQGDMTMTGFDNPPPQGPQTPPPSSPSGEPLPYARAEMDPQARTWGMLCHLAAFAYFIPVGHILGPLIVWLIKKDQYPFVDRQGKESLNFQITMTLCGVVAWLLVFVLIGFLLLPAVFIFNVVMVILAAVKANRGEDVRYPLSIRFIK